MGLVMFCMMNVKPYMGEIRSNEKDISRTDRCETDGCCVRRGGRPGRGLQKAEDTMFWANQRGAPEQHKAVSITDCEIEVDGEELDLFKERDEPEDA